MLHGVELATSKSSSGRIQALSAAIGLRCVQSQEQLGGATQRATAQTENQQCCCGNAVTGSFAVWTGWTGWLQRRVCGCDSAGHLAHNYCLHPHTTRTPPWHRGGKRLAPTRQGDCTQLQRIRPSLVALPVLVRHAIVYLQQHWYLDRPTWDRR